MSYKRLASAVEQTQDMVLVSDTSGKIQYVNQSFCIVTGYTHEDVEGKNANILQSDKTDQATMAEMWNVLEDGNNWKGKFINKKKDGTLFEVDANISPVRNSQGDVENYVAVYRDITKAVLMEKQYRQSQKMEAIGTFDWRYWLMI